MLKIDLNSLNSHETISISLEETEHIIDLYCYNLDYALLKEEKTTSKGLFNFILMIENWKMKIKRMAINKQDFLPFDYSDQYIGFFLIERISIEKIKIQDAYTSEFTGWSTAPSQLHIENLISKPYKLTNEAIVYDIAQLLQEIEASIENFLDIFYVRKK